MGILTGYSEELEFEKDGKKNKKMTIEIEQDGYDTVFFKLFN